MSCELCGHLAHLANGCMRRGVFPSEWKTANLVLFHKDGKDKKQPSSYRPICLLNEIGKFCERVIVGRITQHLIEKVPDLAATQFGFRQERSTLDDINYVKEEKMSRSKVLLAISLDIRNAFNSLSWNRIKEAF